MTIWIDAQLSPALAPWIESKFSVKACALDLLEHGEGLVEISGA
jgi:predicted nuclease of predicted toxin-antitoxin system